jgi:3-phytase
MTERASLALMFATILVAAAPPIAEVPARVETEPAIDKGGDRADDPAIWFNPDDPARSLIISTEKKSGLAIHDLDGKLLRFHPFGKLNNVDLRVGVPIAGKTGVLVAASDRGDKKRPVLRLYRLDPATPQLTPIGSVALPEGEAYGLCLYRHGDRVDAIMVYEEGVVEQVALDLNAATPTGKPVRHFDLGSRSEGCVADDRTGLVYVAEDKKAIWRFSAGREEAMTPVRFASIDGVNLHKDIEGLEILPRGTDGGLLFASSQGNNSYSVYRIDTAEAVGQFRITGGPIDGTEDSDGIAIMPAALGESFPGGLFVAQDGKNIDADGSRAAQNFKLVPLDLILGAIGEK